MATSTSNSTLVAARASGVRSAVLAVVVAAVVSSVLDAVVAAIAHAAGASSAFQPLTAGPFIAFGVLGTIAGTVGWAIIRRRAADPARLLRVLVPVVVIVSLVPDVLVGASSRSMPGASWTGVSFLMVMHVVVATCTVLSLRRYLPLPA